MGTPWMAALRRTKYVKDLELYMASALQPILESMGGRAAQLTCRRSALFMPPSCADYTGTAYQGSLCL